MARDLRELARDLRELPDSIQNTVEQAFLRISRDLEARAKAAAPVDTGKLRSAVTADYTRTGIEAYIDTGIAPYAPYVTDDNPFLTETYDTMSSQINAAIDAAVDGALSRTL
ncbi:MAG: hypothetical protein GF414_01515 [Candidatus Altiarchaeales archaeon]|nr:hypothetical protein [Candidatus Altiarchaeales archaeon]